MWLTAALMAELFKWQYIGCTRIALIHPLFSLKLADIGKFCFICPVVYAGSLPIDDKNV